MNGAAVLNLTLGDMVLSSTEDHVISMVNKRMSEDTSEGITFEVYDDSALILESKIIEGNLDLKFSYGHSLGQLSREYSAKIVNYGIAFRGRGVILSIEAMSEADIEATTETKKKDFKNKRIHEIVRAIALENEWEIGLIVPTKAVYKDTNSTPNIDNEMSFNMENENAEEFIKKKLIPYAISERDGKGDYIFKLEEVDEVKKVYFMPKSWDQETVLEIQYQIGVDSEQVISFEPEFNDTLISMNEGLTVTSETQDPLTNEYIKVETGIKSSMNSTEGYNVNRVIAGSSYSYSQMDALSKNLWEKAMNLGYNATLTLVGDISLEPMTIISVMVITPNGFIHHSTGAYLIESIEDSIEDGVFTTTLNLVRNALMEEEAETEISGEGFDSSTLSYENKEAIPKDCPSSDYLKAASEFLGIKYTWGGNSKEQGLDCSAFVQHVYRKFGVELPRVTTGQENVGKAIQYTSDYKNMKAGDLIFWGTPGSTYHVAMYLGKGYMAHAPKPGDVIKIAKIHSGVTKVRRIR